MLLGEDKQQSWGATFRALAASIRALKAAFDSIIASDATGIRVVVLGPCSFYGANLQELPDFSILRTQILRMPYSLLKQSDWRF